MSNLLLYKLTLAPLLVIAASLAGRKWGQTAAGLVAGFPIVAGPILVFFALEQGPDFAANAALDTLLGIVSLSFFMVGYGWRAWSGGNALSCVLVGWLAFVVGTLLVSRVHASLISAILWALASLFLARKSLPSLEPEAPPAGASAGGDRWDLPLRGISAAALVLLLTHFAQVLGPRWSGFLTPFPVASTVLAVFAQSRGGGAAALAVLKGLLLALNSFAAFCAVLVLALPAHGLVFSFGLALAVASAVQAALFWMILKR